MIKFRDWLNSRELVDSKIEEINFRGLVAGGAMLANLAGAGSANAEEPFHMGGTALIRGQSIKNLQQDEYFINSWTMHKESIQREMGKNPKISSLFIEITTEDHQGKKIAVVTLEAQITAEDKITAKQILIREITRSAAKVGLQAEAIRGLKQIFASNVRNENNNSLFTLKLVIMSDRAYWS